MFNLDLKQRLAMKLVTPEIEALVAAIPKPLGSFGYDAWGYNEDTFKTTLGAAKWLYDKYFRVVVHGLENIPKSGRLMIVGNHSGQLPMDGVLIGVAAATNPDGPRLARAMIERFFPTVPWLGNFLNSLGGVIGDPVNCAKLLELEEAIIIFPEGVRGSGKAYKDRYQLQQFGNGFMHIAMNSETSIVPVGVVGCEETMPSLFNLWPVAKMLGLPYFPMAPLLPLPARVFINFGAPMFFPGGPTTEEIVTDRVEQVKAEIRKLIDVGLAERTSVF